MSGKTGMPHRLTLVRHGESEANVIQKAVKHGILAHYPESFSSIPDREFRLSPIGRDQAKKTGPWMHQEYPEGFDVIFVSDHVRARETAALLCLEAGWEDCYILVDPLMGERSWGRFSEVDLDYRNRIMSAKKRDPLHTPMPDGETLLATRHRSRVLLERIAREFKNKNVLVFSHGEYIEATWAEIEHMTTERQREFFHSSEGDIRNCQVVEFASINPWTSEQDGKIRWVRSSCPQAGVFGDWNVTRPKKFKPQELLDQVYHYHNLDTDEMINSRDDEE